jgi:hypothetical protein
MKWQVSFFCVLVCSHLLFAEETISSLPQPDFSVQSMIEPPLPLSQEFPVALSQDNRQKYLDNPFLKQKEIQNNRDNVKNREFPWFPIFSVLVVASVCLLIWKKQRSYGS